MRPTWNVRQRFTFHPWHSIVHHLYLQVISAKFRVWISNSWFSDKVPYLIHKLPSQKPGSLISFSWSLLEAPCPVYWPSLQSPGVGFRLLGTCLTNFAMFIDYHREVQGPNTVLLVLDQSTLPYPKTISAKRKVLDFAFGQCGSITLMGHTPVWGPFLSVRYQVT